MRDKLANQTALIFNLARNYYSASSSYPSSSPSVLRSLPSSLRLLSSSQSSDHNSKLLPHNALDIKESPFNIPNSLSLARGASGPMIAYLILTEQWPLALGATAVSGATDWLDGHLARRLNQSGVLGSYLDPLGDKLLIGSIISALAYKGMVPLWVAAVVIGRDVVLVGGLIFMRWQALREIRLRGETRGPITLTEFCRTYHASDDDDHTSPPDPNKVGRGLTIGAGALPMMQPLLISKVNTCLQLALVGGSLTHAWLDWPGEGILKSIELITAGTTIATMAAYGHKALFQQRAK